MNEDFIVSELLSELKAENARKSKCILALIISIVIITGSFLLYLNQYDFVSTTTETITAEGVYAIVDSEGNVIGTDLTAEEIQSFVKGVSAVDGSDN